MIHDNHLLALFLNPKFKALVPLSAASRTKVHDHAQNWMAVLKSQACAAVSASTCLIDQTDHAYSYPAKKRRTVLTLDDDFEAWLDNPTSTNCDDEVVRYIKSSFDEELDLSHFCQDGFFDIVKFWTCAAIKPKFPYLSRLTLSVLSIPASSAASERLFSTCGNTITKKRSQLSSECLKSVVVLNSVCKQ